jgi:hypothetical protein
MIVTRKRHGRTLAVLDLPRGKAVSSSSSSSSLLLLSPRMTCSKPQTHLTTQHLRKSKPRQLNNLQIQALKFERLFFMAASLVARLAWVSLFLGCNLPAVFCPAGTGFVVAALCDALGLAAAGALLHRPAREPAALSPPLLGPLAAPAASLAPL